MSANYKQQTHYGKIQALLQEQTPQLAEAVLRTFVERFFIRRHEYLSVLEKLSTPLYLFEPEILRLRSYRLQVAFQKYFEKPAFYYAVKSNNYAEISRLLISAGFGLDVSSGIELEMAVGLDADDIIFSGPGKNRVELEMAVRESDRLVVLVDSFQELAILGQLADASQKAVRIGVRLTTNPEGLWRKFGVLPEMLPQFITQAQCFKNLFFQGIQFHTSWNLNAQAQVDFLSFLGQILQELPAYTRKQISFLDIGGGYWPEQGEWLQPAGTQSGMLRKAMQASLGDNQQHYCLSAHSIEDFAEQLSRAIQAFILPHIPQCRICLEPGRWLCNDVMHLLMSVVDKKSDDLVITDAGTNAVGWERFETDYCPVLNLSRPVLLEKPCHVLGSLCTPHDVWGYNYWGADIRIGDVLLIPNQGAYTYSLRQNFIKPLPEVAVITDAHPV